MFQILEISTYSFPKSELCFRLKPPPRPALLGQKFSDLLSIALRAASKLRQLKSSNPAAPPHKRKEKFLEIHRQKIIRAHTHNRTRMEHRVDADTLWSPIIKPQNISPVQKTLRRAGGRI